MVSADDYLRFDIKNEDGTFNESINIDKSTVSKVEDIVEFLKENYGDNLADKMLEIFVEFALEYGVRALNKNRKLIIKLSGDE